MKIEVSAVKQEPPIEATYVEAARRGEHRWWRYLLGLLVILVSWLVVGSLASVGTAFLLGGQADGSGLGGVGGFLFNLVGFPFFLAGVVIAVSLVHRRHPRTLVTARQKLNWRRIGQGFVAWFVLACLVFGPGQYLLYPDSFSFAPDLGTVALFVPLALVLIAIQTTTEELFFRGYVMQGASLMSTNRVFLALLSSVIFTLPHLANPEASAGGWLTIFFVYFLGTGVVWAVVSLEDGSTELAIGAHFANNIFSTLVINPAGSALSTPALFTVDQYYVTYGALSVLILIPAFLAICYKFFRRDQGPEPGPTATERVLRDPIEIPEPSNTGPRSQ